MNSLYQRSFQTQKLADDLAARGVNLRAAVNAAAARDEILNGTPKVAGDATGSTGPTEVGQVHNAFQEMDKEEQTVEGLKEQVMQNAVKGGRIYSTGAKIDMPKVAEFLPLAAAHNYVGHLKSAEFAPQMLEKVACPQCDGARCGVCDGLGIMTKAAAEDYVNFVDAQSDLVFCVEATKIAEEAIEGQSEGDMGFLQQQVAGAGSALDAHYLQMHPDEPIAVAGVQPAAKSIKNNPLYNFLPKNF